MMIIQAVQIFISAGKGQHIIIAVQVRIKDGKSRFGKIRLLIQSVQLFSNESVSFSQKNGCGLGIGGSHNQILQPVTIQVPLSHTGSDLGEFVGCNGLVV